MTALGYITVIALFTASCTKNGAGPTEAILDHNRATSCTVGQSLDMKVVNGCPYIVARITAGGNSANAVMLLDTGTTSTLVDKVFAQTIGIETGTCKFSGSFEIAADLMPTDFNVAGPDASCESVFTNKSIVQNGIIAVDNIVEYVLQFDFDAARVSAWTPAEWEHCYTALPPHKTIRFSRGPTDVVATPTTPTPACVFENPSYLHKVSTGCNVPYVQTVFRTNTEIISTMMQIDTGREETADGDITVNAALRDVLVAKGLLDKEDCKQWSTGKCERSLFNVTTALSIDFGLGAIGVRTIEFRGPSYREPYSDPVAAGLLGMKLLPHAGAVILDPVHSEMIVLPHSFGCVSTCGEEKSTR